MTKENSLMLLNRKLERVLLLLLLLIFVLIKVIFIMYSQPLPDEAYYWLWSNKVALSYFDHPPLTAWVMALLVSYFDNNYFVISARPLLSLVIVMSIMITWQKHMLRRFDYHLCLKSMILFLALPIYTIFFSISFPDHLLIALLFASSFCLFLYFESDTKARNGIYFWYSAVLLFSFALLTKYNAILFGLGALSYILYYKEKLRGPTYGHIVASIVIIILIQVPVLVWNFGNDFGSFNFHLSERFDQEKNIFTIFRNNIGFLLGVFFAFSPIFIFNLKNIFFLENYSSDVKNFLAMSKFVFIFSLGFCIILSFFTNVLYYWATPALILLIPFLINILKSELAQYIHIFYGILISLILLINISFYPISAFFGNVDRETAILYGWEKLIDIVGREKELQGAEKIVFSDYRLGSLYIFHSGDFEADVLMEGRRTQFDIWREEKSAYGRNTIIIADNDFPIGQKISSNFEKIVFVRDIKISLGNKLIKRYQVFLGTNT